MRGSEWAEELGGIATALWGVGLDHGIMGSWGRVGAVERSFGFCSVAT